MERQRHKIVILGSGNVATHLAQALDKHADVVQVWSRSSDNARTLASRLRNSDATADINDLRSDADFYLVCVADDGIRDVVKGIKGVSGVIASTSGSISLIDFKSCTVTGAVGVFYPLQTFTKEADLDISHVPFLIEASDKETTRKLKKLASLVSDKVFEADSELRVHLHLAAVFSNNFVNHLWTLADGYLKDKTGFDIHILEPLLKETLRKALASSPAKAQTGPARRNDRLIIEKHLDMLDDGKAEIYRLLSESIIKTYSSGQNE